MKPLFSFIFCCCLGTVFSQGELPLDYQLRLAQQGLSWVGPEDVPLRVRSGTSEHFQRYDFSVLLRKDKLEVRYLFVPDGGNEQDVVPHAKALTMAMHLASNDEDSYLSAHEIDPALLDSVYQADWGKTFFLRPKPMFSLAKDCQLVAIYREGVGLLYTFMLFDEPSATLPERATMVRFTEKKLID